MDDYQHTNLLVLQSAELTERTPFCPEDREIAEYFDGQVVEVVRQSIEHHLDNCRFCLARIGMLDRQRGEFGDQRVPEEVLATAKKLAKPAPAWWLKRTSTWASAAMVLIAVFSIMNIQKTSAPTSGPGFAEEFSAEQASRQLRSIDRSPLKLEVLSPVSGKSVAHGSLIQWAEVPGHIHYDIFILSNSGDVLWTERLQDNEWVFREALRLPAGSEFFFRVEAVLPDGGAVSSRHTAFQVSEQN